MTGNTTTGVSQGSSGQKKSFLTGALKLPGKFVGGIYAVAKIPFGTGKISDAEKDNLAAKAGEFKDEAKQLRSGLSEELLKAINNKLAAVEQSAYELDASSNQGKTVWFWIASHAALFVFNPVLGTGLIIVDGIATYLDKIWVHKEEGNWRLRTAAVLNTRFFARAGVFRFSGIKENNVELGKLEEAKRVLDKAFTDTTKNKLMVNIVENGHETAFKGVDNFGAFEHADQYPEIKKLTEGLEESEKQALFDEIKGSINGIKRDIQQHTVDKFAKILVDEKVHEQFPDNIDAFLEQEIGSRQVKAIQTEIQELIKDFSEDKKAGLRANISTSITSYNGTTDDAKKKTFADHPYKDLAASHSALTKITKNLDALIAPAKDSSKSASLGAGNGA